LTNHAAGDYLVYPCSACGKRIFTARGNEGREGTCPLCGQQHLVGGQQVVAAEEGVERRAAERVAVDHGQVEVEGGSLAGTLPNAALHPLHDLSETGIGFHLAGIRDRKRISGSRPPDVKVGQVLRITIHAPELFRPRTYKAEVRRVVPAPGMPGMFVIGAQFSGLTPEQEAEVRALVRRMAGS
jgi:DNA-directed RNA polymerase subunit RPC12/RpoP